MVARFHIKRETERRHIFQVTIYIIVTNATAVRKDFYRTRMEFVTCKEYPAAEILSTRLEINKKNGEKTLQSLPLIQSSVLGKLFRLEAN